MHRNTLVLILILFLSGCGTTSSFREANQGMPHATLKLPSYMGIGNALLVEEINGEPPSAWKMTHHQFLVSPGHIVLLLKSCQSPKYGYIGSGMVKIDVEAGRTYSFTIDLLKDSIVLKVTRDDGGIVYSNDMALDPGYCN